MTLLTLVDRFGAVDPPTALARKEKNFCTASGTIHNCGVQGPLLQRTLGVHYGDLDNEGFSVSDSKSTCKSSQKSQQ